MEQERALAVFGLGPDAGPQEVEKAYAVRSRVLKRRIVQAGSVDDRNHNRRLLRDLVEIRDIALGPEAAAELHARREGLKRQRDADWWQPSLGVPGDIADRRAALQFLGLGPFATAGQIEGVFHRRSRMLKARIAKAPTQGEMQQYREALRRLNDIFHLAAAPRPAREAGPDLAHEETLSDVVGIGQTVEFEEEGASRPGSPAQRAERDKRLSESAFELEILLPGQPKDKGWKGPEETM